jgi:transcriptional regulator with XRE-family HTH domain
MTPGDRLRAARLNAGFKSVAKAAEALGMSESSYRAHENGQNQFTPAQAQRYAEAFDSDAAWLLYGDAEDHGGPNDFVAAVTLSSSAILAALVQSLHDKGLLNGEETVEIYEQALLLLEMQQAQANENPAFGQIMEMARELIEQHLRRQ